MQKSKLGLPAGLAAAIMYMTGVFGGYFPALLLAGFVLLYEEENFIRRAAVKTVILMFLFSILNFVIYLIPDIVGIFQNLLAIFKVYFATNFLDNISATFGQTLSLVETVLFLVLAVLALFGKSVDVKPLSNWADK